MKRLCFVILLSILLVAVLNAEPSQRVSLKELGRKPFVGNKVWALRTLGFTAQEVVELTKKIEQGIPDGRTSLKKGDLLAMVYGYDEFYPEAEMDFPDGHLEPAEVYRAKSGNEAVIPERCNNISRFILPPPLPRRPPPVAQILSPPPAPPLPPPPPELYNAALKQILEVMYKEVICPNCQLDAATGGVWQKYSDGAKDYSSWLYAAVRCEVWTDSNGNIHKPGIFFNGSRWTGNWQNVVDFQGVIKTYGLEHRIQTPDNREFAFRLGYYTRKDTSSSADMWGTSREESRFKAISFESSVDDMSRIDKIWLPRWKAGVALITELSAKRDAAWTNAMTGRIVNLNERPNTVSGFEFKFEPRFFQDERKIIALSTEAWANFLFDGDNVEKLTPYFGILGDSLKVGYQWTNRNTNGSHAIGDGLAWQVNFYDLYAYIKYRGWQPKEKTYFHSEDPARALFEK